MATKFSAAWPAESALMFAYLTTMKFERASHILGLWNKEEQTMNEYASSLIEGIPAAFFLRPLPVPSGPHFEISDGRLIYDPLCDKSHVINHEELKPFVDLWDRSNNVPLRPSALRKTRPLNSFMAFRTWLAPVFDGLTQKHKSQCIAQLWAEDPLKSHWEVLAKTYNELRDRYDLEDGSLTGFLRRISRFVNFPIPSKYVTMCGWTVEKTKAGVELNRAAWVDDVRMSLIRTPLDIFEIIEFVTLHIRGYAILKPVPLCSSLNDSAIAILNGRTLDPVEWDFDLASGEFLTAEDPYLTLRDMFYVPDEGMHPINDLIHYAPNVDPPEFSVATARLLNTKAMTQANIYARHAPNPN
ncbi:hypothetical protein N7495_009481 [Penicillium taxi]|uniref:uncharacterized protein n=1 Tax=Penicillium taxi TaxID=168475 RepID=UPI002544E4CF|nr:uncharacterized protein N7495_009481 [Penicillium taxi]KAJ5884971.1 hypothetical protein N7495_009481 [Penicillium taxi]